MPIFERPPLASLPPVRDRWTPIFLEHGRVEVDDSSVKWIGADKTIVRLPVATLSVLLLGPGTTITHAAIKACAECNTAVCWVGSDGLRFYATGTTPTSTNANARIQVNLAASTKKRTEVAKRMFEMRFGKSENLDGKSIKTLMGMEGKRIKQLYADLGQSYGVTWKGRNYNASSWDLSDGINRAVSACNAALYSLTLCAVTSLGYLPQIGFIHSSGTLPFVFDIADIYKPEISLPAAFETLSLNPKADSKDAVTKMKSFVEKSGLMRRLPVDIEKLLKGNS